PQRSYGALEQRGVGDIEGVSLLLQDASAFERLGPALFRKVHIGPSGKPVLPVPLAFAVTHQDQLEHRSSLAARPHAMPAVIIEGDDQNTGPRQRPAGSAGCTSASWMACGPSRASTATSSGAACAAAARRPG